MSYRVPLALSCASRAFDRVHPFIACDVQRWRDAGVIHPIDTARIPRWNNILPQLRGINGFEKDGEVWAMPWDWGYSVIAYNPELLPSDNPDFNMMVDPAAKGRVAMNSQFDVAIMVAGVIGGFPDLFNPTESEIEKLPGLWRQMLDNSRILWTDRSEVEQAFALQVDTQIAIECREDFGKSDGAVHRFAAQAGHRREMPFSITQVLNADRAFSPVDGVDADLGRQCVGQYG